MKQVDANRQPPEVASDVDDSKWKKYELTHDTVGDLAVGQNAVYRTTIRAKAWTNGQTEPGSWQVSATDSASALQVAGSVGFRLWLTSAVTNSPIQVGFDDYTVNPG